MSEKYYCGSHYEKTLLIINISSVWLGLNFLEKIVKKKKKIADNKRK